MKLPERRSKLPDQTLNINALMDVLTVLLFFLIKSFTVTSQSITIPDNVRMPSSIVKDEEIEDGMNVTLSHDQLILNNNVILKLRNGEFSAQDIGSDGRTITNLKTLLQKEFKKKQDVLKKAANSDETPAGKITIVSDKRLKFKTLKYLLHTASSSGYSDYQFVIMTEDDGA